MKNKNIKLKTGFNFLIFIFTFSFLLLTLAPAAQAINIPGWPLVPCGLSQDNPGTPGIKEDKPCGRCDLFQLLKNLIDFVIGGLMPPLAVLLFVWAGFLILLSGANPGLYAQGQTIFKNTFYGIIILLSAWMITNSLILSIGAKYNNAGNWWQFTCVEPAPVQPPPGGVLIINTNNLPNATVGQPYSQTLQVSGGVTPYGWTMIGSPPPGLTFNTANGIISGTPTTAGTSTFTIRVTDASSPPKSSEKQLSITVSDAPTGNLIITTTSLPNATQNQSYSQTISATGGTVPYFWSVSVGSLPSGLTVNSSSGLISGTPTAVGTSTFTILLVDNATPPNSATKQLSIVVGGIAEVTCKFTGVNLCQASNRTPYNNQTMVCSASACGQYTSAISQYAGRTGVTNGANFLKAIMIKESSCDVGRQSGSVPPSCGLMQLKASTANIYKTRCGVPANVDITCDWLKQPTNANTSICIAAEFMGALTQTSCGSSPRGVAAGYNGGSGACQNSSDCATETSCAGGPVKKWECLYDNPEHTICNDTRPTNYDETRDYVIKVLYCYNNPGF